jgi:hypothetical protein
MRYFFRQKVPKFARVLLVESGSRHLVEHLLRSLRQHWDLELMIDLVTCYTGVPAGFPPELPTPHTPQLAAPYTRVFRVSDYAGSSGRRRLYNELRAHRYSVLGIICSGEPIMTKWKWAIAARLPAKVFVLNENGDYFWLDYSQRGVIRHFVLFRAGLSGAGAVRTLARLALFPFTILYLLLYAAAVHLRRKVHA